jgi:3-oxoacyl-[acyl-carrier-protein] synthase II
MTVEVVVTGMGLLSCLGSLEQSWHHLLAAKSGIALAQPFDRLSFFPLGEIAPHPANLAKLTLSLVKDTLHDARLTAPLPDCAVVIGSSRGCQASWEEAVSHKNYKDWLEILPHRAAVAAANYLQTTASVLSPMAACATGIQAIARGYELIQTGHCQRVIVGAVETPITELTLAAFDRMGALATTGCYPFDRDREGLVLGEGGALFILETAELARRRGASIYGKILGFGLTCDAYHISAPDANRQAAIRAIEQCLSRSNLLPQDIDYIHAHGTSTQLNDYHEARSIERLFPQGVAVSSTKGSTGHTLGASGAIGVAFCLMSLQTGYLPPCVGLKRSEFNIDLVTQSRKVKVDRALCFSFGFGGQNAILALGKYLDR